MTLEELRRQGLSGDDVLATPGSKRERGRDSLNAVRAHLEEVEKNRQKILEHELDPQEIRKFHERSQRT